MSPRTGWFLVLAGALAVGVPALLLVSGPGWISLDQSGAAKSPPNLTIPRPQDTAPAAAVKPVHRALHTLGRLCRRGAVDAKATQARRPVMVILAFARQYPNVTFPLDDETGTTLSLLFVARNEVTSCAPALTALVERLIPPEFLPPPAGRSSNGSVESAGTPTAPGAPSDAGCRAAPSGSSRLQRSEECRVSRLGG